MKSLFAFLFVVIVAVAAIGWWKGWYRVTTNDDGSRSTITIDIDRDKATKDVQDFTAMAKDKLAEIEQKLKELRDRSSKSSGEAKKQLDLRIRELEQGKGSVEEKVKQAADPGSKANRPSGDALEKELDDLLKKAREESGGN